MITFILHPSKLENQLYYLGLQSIQIFPAVGSVSLYNSPCLSVGNLLQDPLGTAETVDTTKPYLCYACFLYIPTFSLKATLDGFSLHIQIAHITIVAFGGHC